MADLGRSGGCRFSPAHVDVDWGKHYLTLISPLQRSYSLANHGGLWDLPSRALILSDTYLEVAGTFQ
jgi:hypothetical protein